MKTQSFRIATGTFLLAAAVFINAGAASLPEPAVKDSTDKNIQVRCLGVKDNLCQVNIKYNNTTGSKFNVAVKDKDGYIIFQESYSDKKFDKLFKIKHEEEGTITFIIRNLNDNTTSTFHVNTTRRYSEALMITKVN